MVAGLICPTPAEAQKGAFVEALIAFRTSLAGSHGDEGPEITANLDRMAESLAAWDQTIEAAAAELRPQLTSAAAEDGLRVRATLASLFLERGRFSEAVAELDAAVATDPDRAAFHLFRGLAHDASGAAEEALRDFRQAWALDSGDPIKAYLLATRLPPAERQPQIESLMAAQQAAMTAPAGPASPSFIQLALIEDRAADWAVFSPAAYVEGFTHLDEGRYAEAVESFRAATSSDPLVADRTARTDPMARGISRLRAKRIADAIVDLEAAVAAAPGSSEAHRILGLAYDAAGRGPEGSAHLATAVRLAPGDERARLALARGFMRDGRHEEAEAALRQTLELLPQSAEAHWVLADLYESRNRGPEAIRELEAATAFPLLAGRGVLFWRLASLYHRHQDYEGVTRALAERARFDPNEAIVHKDLGLAHMRRGAREDALIELLLSSVLGPGDPETLANIGQIHLESERYEAAEAVLQRAVALAPEAAQARFALGTSLVRLGRADEGREQLAEFARLRDAELEEQRRTFTRESLLRDAAEHTSEGRHEAAAATWEEVVALEPSEPAHRIALAGALVRAGQLEAAAVQLEQAAAMNVGQNVYRQLASIYEKLGRAEDSARAQATYERLVREGASSSPTP